MIARIWNGKTSLAQYEEYTEFLKRVAIPDYRGITGCKGLSFLRQVKNGEGHFTLVTYWESIDSIKQFAGEDYQEAKYYPEDDHYLLAFEETVEHFEVFA